MKPLWYAWPLLLASALIAADAAKPPLVDDPAYLAVARQIAVRPADPYGFEQFWYADWEPANQVLAPPVVPYWLGIGIRLFGENIAWLKLWLYPFAAIFSVSLFVLLHRFARGVEAPALAAAVLSPLFLPAMNLMLDIPALALSLAAVAVFLRGLERRSLRLALAAGLLAGLAAQTKYTALLLPPLFLGMAWWRRWSPAGILAALTTASIFVGWEYYTHRRYGESHFLVSLRLSETTPFTRIAVFMSLFELLGLVGPGVVLIVMVGLRFRERWLILAAVILIAQYGALCVVPWSSASSWQDPYKPRLFGFNVLVIGSWGWATLISLGLALRPLVWRSRPPAGSWRSWLAGHRNRRHPMTGLLAAWLLAEAAAFMTLTPFPASRRIMGISVVIFLLVARLSSRVVRLSGSRKRLWWAAALSAGLGALYATIDAEDAGFEPRAIAAADDYIRAHDPNPTVWYFGHWGFQYAAEKRGYQPVIAGPNLPRVGDWLVEPPLWLRLRPYGRDERPGELACTITLDRWLRLRTMPPYYGGMHAMEWWPRPHFEAKVYRIDSNWEVKHP